MKLVYLFAMLLVFAFLHSVIADIPMPGGNAELCGDGRCDSNENIDNCPRDCTPPYQQGEVIRNKEVPEIVIESISINPVPSTGDNVMDCEVRIKNIGGVVFDGKIVLNLMLDGNQVRSNTIDETIAPGDERVYDIGRGAINNPGEHTILVKLGYVSNDGWEKDISKSVDFSVNPMGDKITKESVPLVKTNPNLSWMLLVIAITVMAVIVLFAFFLRRRDKKDAESRQKIDAQKTEQEGDAELGELLQKKEELEEIIKIAKVKFYKRKLDEDSYKEIVKNNQGKLIEIEAKIEKLDKRVSRLEADESSLKDGK